jgi:hypothetical protein
MIGAAETLPPPGRIQPIYLEGKLLPLAAPVALDLGLRDGQVIQATVNSSGSDMSLLLQGKSIDLPENLASGLVPGQSMWWRVQENAQGEFSLLPLAQPTAKRTHSVLISRLSSLLYRPKEDNMVPLLGGRRIDQWLQMLSRSDLQAQWRSLLVSPSHLSAETIRLALLGALGHEAWFGRGRPNPGADLKQFLRSLLKALEASPDGTKAERSQLQDSIDSLESNQVQALQAQIQNEVLFSLTLPFVGGDCATLTFRRAAPQEGRSPAFTVNVHSKSADLGPVWLQTRLTGNQQVDLTMWAQMQSVADQARARQADLAIELKSSGLILQTFQVIHGARPTEDREWTPSGRGLVVDISA